MSSPWIVLLATVALIAASAFFVAVEFALIAARRHRLEDAARTSRSARAALRSASELSVLLAGSQLGITVCTLALGAITKPAVHYWLTPAFESAGAPAWLADVTGFVLALLIVTFLHLVIGEMAPKSWAIAHPETSATLLAVPMRAFMWFTRPLLTRLNRFANRLLRAVGVDPVDEVVIGSDPETLRELVRHSASVGSLGEEYHRPLTAALELQTLTLGDIVALGSETPVVSDASAVLGPLVMLGASSVDLDADLDDIRSTAHRSGHLRLLVRGPSGVDGVVHVRDAVHAAPTSRARDLMRPVLTFGPATPVHEALQTIRDSRSHIGMVVDDHGIRGVVTLTDILDRLLTVRA